MIETNSEILDFVKNNYLLIFIILFFVVRIIPSEWAGFWKYKNNNEQDGRAPRVSVLRFIIHSVVDGIFAGVLINILALFDSKKTVTLLIFIVVGFDIFSRHQISAAAVTLVAIGIIALYLESLIDTGKHLELFKGLLTWDKDGNSSPRS